MSLTSGTTNPNLILLLTSFFFLYEKFFMLESSRPICQCLRSKEDKRLILFRLGDILDILVCN